MPDLLLEIGTEEIPAGYIVPALESLASTLAKRLSDARISFGKTQTFGTPRRLAVWVSEVAGKQDSLETELTGPPHNIAFDSDGQPTKAAVKFAEKAGVSIDKLKIKQTAKGAYLSAVKKEKGLASRSLLKSILPEVIAATAFPKHMRWAELSFEFARPIQSVLAVFGGQVISFQTGNIKSGRTTYGHRFLHSAKIKINDPADYVSELRKAFVVVDISERKALIRREISAAAASVGASVLDDPELLDVVVNLVEYPAVSTGCFDRDFLRLPDDVLITAMREHQKYFAVVDDQHRLRPYFIAVNNTPATDMKVVARGHERVLRARLEDANFFYDTDLKVSFEEQVEKLKGVLFQAQLGSMYEKAERVAALASSMAEQLQQTSEIVGHVTRAAHLCKVDLVTLMVNEFPKLQGIMGRVYARERGEPEEVATAIEEHYRPIFSGAALPQTPAGSILAIADKIDTICGCFSVGLIPSGTADPYALRRQGIGIIQIMAIKEFPFSLSKLIGKSLQLFEDQATQNTGEAFDRILTFLQNRMTGLLVDEGYAKDSIAAVIGASSDQIPDIRQRVRALENLKRKADFAPLAAAFKRVVNIIKKSEVDPARSVDQSLFEHESESALWGAFNAVRQKIETDMGKGRFDQALINIASLKKPVDDFFDDVLVMADDLSVRQNRLALLGQIAGLFGKFADFSKISS